MIDSFTKSFYNKYLGCILIFMLLLHCFASFLIQFFRVFSDKYLVLPTLAVVKLLFFAFTFSVLFLNFKKRKVLIAYLTLLILVYTIANFTFNLNAFSYETARTGNFFYLIKYLFPFLFIGAFSLVENRQELIRNYFKILENILIVNSILVIIGFLFSLDFFQSYPNTNRFGYTGILEAGFYNYMSIIVISRSVFLQKIDYKLLLLLIASLLAGTKLMILFFGVLLFYYLYVHRKMLLVSIYSGVFILGILFLNPILNLVVKIFPLWKPLLENHGALTVLTSTRNWSVERSVTYLKMNGTLNEVLFGVHQFSSLAVEMDFIDLLLFFGIIGSVVYMVLLSKMINKSYHLIPLITAFFSGDFLLGTIIMGTYFVWLFESNKRMEGFL